MINAKELKRKQEELWYSKDKKELEEIEQKLLQTIKSNRTYIYLNSITSNNFKYLESLGYKIEQHYDQKDGDWIIISW